MKTKNLVALAIPCLFVASCVKSIRSVSNSGYRDASAAAYRAPHPNTSDPGFEYRGELSEFDLLGVTRGSTASDADIQRALEGAKQMRLKPGSAILLVQSGAQFPYGPMVSGLSKPFLILTLPCAPTF